jgi:hypothetical protein
LATSTKPAIKKIAITIAAAKPMIGLAIVIHLLRTRSGISLSKANDCFKPNKPLIEPPTPPNKPIVTQNTELAGGDVIVFGTEVSVNAIIRLKIATIVVRMASAWRRPSRCIF